MYLKGLIFANKLNENYSRRCTLKKEDGFSRISLFRYLASACFRESKKLTIEYTSFCKLTGMWCCKTLKKPGIGLLIGSRDQLPS